MLKDTLVSAPILKYPDTSKPYTIFTDASKYGWAGVLMQEHTSVLNGKKTTTKHPVVYISGLFQGSQLNWVAMTKEVYAIYMTVKKLFILQEKTMSSQTHLERLIDIDPDIELQPELKDYEFGHYAFETLPKAKGKAVHEVITSLGGVNICEVNITYNNSENSPYSVKLPLSNKKFSCLQDKDLKVRQLKQKVIQAQYTQFYFIKKGVLYRSMVDNGHKFEAAVVPDDLIHTVLHLGHNQSSHNRYQRTYAAIKHVYYWKGMRKHILVHCKGCAMCAKQRVQKTQFEKQIFEPGVQPMEFVCINLIGEFYPPSSKGNRYTLTAVLYAYRVHIFHPHQE